MAGNLAALLFWVVVGGAIVYNLFIKKAQNRTKAATGKDLERVRQAVRELLPEGSQNAENLASSKYLPMNILQEDKCAAFERFISPLAQKVAADNPGIDEMIAQKSAGGKAGVAIGLAVGGLLGGIFVPPVGLFLCVVALALSIRAKKWSGGRNGMASLIVSVICLLLSAAWCAFFLWMSFSTL